MNRLAKFGAGGVLNVYVPLGYPTLQESFEFACAALQNGAHGLELGLPFSDPAADGPVIQNATHAALENGTTVAQCLDLASRLRAKFPEAPLIAMTYANLAFKPGWTQFAQSLAAAGIDGLILPDVPLEESAPIRAALDAASIAWIPLVTPSTPLDRMAKIAATGTGFLYVVANVGITGQSDPGPLVEGVVKSARATGTELPLLVGFGIASRADVERVWAAGADGAIVGSHLVALMTDGLDAYGAAVARLAGKS